MVSELDSARIMFFPIFIFLIQVIGLVPGEWKPNNSKVNGNFVGEEGWGYIGGKLAKQYS